jgi:hypothetical protein
MKSRVKYLPDFIRFLCIFERIHSHVALREESPIPLCIYEGGNARKSSLLVLELGQFGSNELM